MSEEHVLRASGLRLSIGGASILDGIDLEVSAGELIGVIGPNGAGKTTLFNVLSGIVTPTAGRVWLHGHDVTSRSVVQRARAGLGRSFQTSNLFPELTALENVRIAAQAALGGSLSLLTRPRSADAATAAARQRLAEVGLADRAGSPVAALAHGEQRKVEIAMLLALDTKVILLDEPMAGVATGDVAGLVELIRLVHREQGRTVLMVEHHIDVVLGLADRVAVLHHGRLLACASPAEVMADPLVQKAYLGRAA
ncbi:MAG TPA: ABC transporter ATP-binding protein [Jatrophihabitans sp.]|jgi:branched-chain amino acid transport system ATP-binding protein|uniref:ABC transporter ATP-binding protein n=1 Tax=Jatrophihabitans sp. TaxID=1932789 RepID=UPI002EEEFDA9